MIWGREETFLAATNIAVVLRSFLNLAFNSFSKLKRNLYKRTMPKQKKMNKMKLSGIKFDRSSFSDEIN